MRICLIGCVEFSGWALKRLFELESVGICTVAGVITKKASSFNADFCDLSGCVEEVNADPAIVHFYKNQEAATSFIRDVRADIVFCFGWSSLLGPEMLSAAPRGVIGFHPAALPQNRGRHPIIWALVLGLDETASTFFQMDEKADSGPILSQKPVPISPDDNASTLYQKITETALAQIEQFTPALVRNSAKFQPQDHTQATYWRKRSLTDGIIDWRMDAVAVHNLVRALHHPYPGAEFQSVQHGAVKVWQTSLSESLFSRNFEPGKILDVQPRRVLVKCGGESAIWLENIKLGLNCIEGGYL
ncbi:formyl transferase [Halomonas sp. DQ26W]|uniref:formyltransferase family protein n=1 Tax=Halomonas sp. DQ26W TaxID=2282311 RepID=UPI000DF7700C|nr:formyltransferase family protein [Halomonas sp. DQ26W]RDB42158.1 formyl transferase [Halomonas sp. DQ26W]